MTSSRTFVLPGLLLATGPVLAFPEIIPPVWRVPLVSVLVAVVVALSLASLRPRGAVGAGLWLFTIMLFAGWVVRQPFDAKGVSHFAGAGLGILTMSTVAVLATTIERLRLAALAFTGGATAILIAGLLSVSVNTGKYFGLLRELPLSFVEALPNMRLGLPGMGPSGTVNANALGGTALSLLPASAGIAAAAGGRLFKTLAISATTLAGLAMLASRSRTAMVAALVLLVFIGALMLRRRKAAVAVLLIVSGLAAYQLATFDNGARFLRHSLDNRTAVWSIAVDRIASAPVFGIGISQFRELGPQAHPAPPTVAHAHNIFLQTALDTGLPGLAGYLLFVGGLMLTSYRRAATPDGAGRIAAGAGLTLAAAHLFGLADAIALGAKVGAFQWFAAGLILAASRIPPAHDPAR